MKFEPPYFEAIVQCCVNTRMNVRRIVTGSKCLESNQRRLLCQRMAVISWGVKHKAHLNFFFCFRNFRCFILSAQSVSTQKQEEIHNGHQQTLLSFLRDNTSSFCVHSYREKNRETDWQTETETEKIYIRIYIYI